MGSGVSDDRAAEEALQAELGALLRDLGLLDDEAPSFEPAGDGNINWVRRVRSHSGRTVVVKHARPTLERFPQYRTSTKRIVFEHRYYEIARACDESRVCPSILYFDEARRLLVLKDLCDAERLDAVLLRGGDVDAALLELAAFLGRVHRSTWGDAGLAERFDNGAIQRLHGDHIFALPYEENDFPLPPDVAAHARRARADGVLREIAATAYRRYLEPRGALVHGDAQPGNILLAARGPTLLDAEIAHVGDPAFDLGTLLAHVWLARLAGRPATPAAGQAGSIWTAYRAALGGASRVRFDDVARYAGLEMMRRTIGAARVAAVESTAASLRAIDVADRLVRNPPRSTQGIDLP